MATHRAPRRFPGGPRAAVAGALVLVVGGTGFALAHRGSTAPGTAPVAATSTPRTSPSTPSSSTLPASPSPSSPTAATAGAGTPEPAAWKKCTAQLRAGDSLLSAARSSELHWTDHYGAQVRFDQHKQNLTTTRAQFAASKAAGAGDGPRFAAADRDYRSALKAGTCNDLAAVVPAAHREAADHCMARARAQSSAIDAGRAVNDDWQTHVTMMRGGMNHGQAAYLARWRSMVNAAPAHTAAFDRARRAMSKAPGCSPPSA